MDENQKRKLQDLKSDLKQLGIRENSVLLVHSSLRSLGKFPGKAELVIEALQQSVGDYGTLLMPALSYDTVNGDHPYFDVRNTPSCVGALTEYFRKQPGVIRSVMPTHSVCGIGHQVKAILNGHINDFTPCGPNSPYTKLKEKHGQILFIGCGLKPNTSMHAIEELVAPPYLFGDYIFYEVTLVNGNKTYMKVKRYNFYGYELRYDRVENIMEDKYLRKGKVLEADCFLIDAPALWESVHEKLLPDPLFFVDKIAK